MSRPQLASAILLAFAVASGTPSENLWPPVSVEVDGLDAQPHRLLVLMGAGPGVFGGTVCEPGVFALYEDGLVIFTGKPPECPRMQAQLAPETARGIADDLFTLGFASFPHKQSVAAATDLGGVSIKVRRGRRWHATEVYGLTRFGEVICCDDEVPYPRFVGAVKHLTGFDAPQAKVWEPQEFAIWFNSGAYYPPEDVARAVPWPEGIPEPVLQLDSPVGQTRVFDMRFWERARSLEAQSGPPFVLVHGKPWRVGIFPVLPEYLYHEAVDRALSRARWALQGEHGR